MGKDEIDGLFKDVTLQVLSFIKNTYSCILDDPYFKIDRVSITLIFDMRP